MSHSLHLGTDARTKQAHTSRTLAARQGNRTFKIYRMAQNFYMELNFMILWLLAET